MPEASCSPSGERATKSDPCRLPAGLYSTTGLAVREALIEGRAVVTAHLWLVDDLLASGAVQQVLPDFTLSSVPLSILFVPARARIARVRLLINALATFLHKLPGVHDQP